MDSLLWAEAIPEDAKEAPQGLKPEEEIARFTVRASLSACAACVPLCDHMCNLRAAWA
jgi:hypothetical protein